MAMRVSLFNCSIVRLLISVGIVWGIGVITSQAQQGLYRVSNVEWASVHNVETVLKLPGLSAAMQSFQVTPSPKLVIYYPHGQQGNLWAISVQNWMVSLGVPLKQIELKPSSDAADVIELDVVSAPTEIIVDTPSPWLGDYDRNIQVDTVDEESAPGVTIEESVIESLPQQGEVE